jgi:hypothetical protein
MDDDILCRSLPLASLKQIFGKYLSKNCAAMIYLIE